MDRTLSDLLLVASVQHLRLTIEELGVGLVTIDQNGCIVSLDEWSESITGLSTEELKGQNIGTIFSAASGSTVDAIVAKTPGYIGKLSLATRDRPEILAHVVLDHVATGVKPDKFTLQLIFTFDAQ